MKKSTQWFWILFAVWMMLIFTLTAFYLLEYIMPFLRSVSWVENSTIAFYNAYSWVEQAAYRVKKGAIGLEPTKSLSSSINNTFGYTGSTLSNTHPKTGLWNSPFDSTRNWSIVSAGRPIQIYLPTGVNLNSVYIYFRVPNFDSSATTYEIFDDSSFPEKDIVNWQLSHRDDVLNSQSWNRIRMANICNSRETCNSSKAFSFTTPSKSGFLLDDTVQTFSTFYSSKCSPNYSCMLKFTIINDLIACQSTTSTCAPSAARKRIPYLEYKIEFGVANVPANVINIASKWKSSGFQKALDVIFPQKGTIEAFDFTVFQ